MRCHLLGYILVKAAKADLVSWRRQGRLSWFPCAGLLLFYTRIKLHVLSYNYAVFNCWYMWLYNISTSWRHLNKLVRLFLKTMDKGGNNSGAKGRKRSGIPCRSRMTDLSAPLLKYSLSAVICCSQATAQGISTTLKLSYFTYTAGSKDYNVIGERRDSYKANLVAWKQLCFCHRRDQQ